MNLTEYATYRALSAGESGGGGGSEDVTVLHGHGTAPVPLPDGVTFPAVADITPDDESTPDGPYVKAIVLYVDSLVTDNVTKEESRRRAGCNMSSFTMSGDRIDFRRSFPDEVELYFTVTADGITPTGGYLGMNLITINEDTDWMMVIIDTRKETP